MFNLFKKKEQLPQTDFSAVKADMHSHLIPGIDDGAPNLEASILLLQKIQTLGFEKVVTTPHIMADYYRNTPEIILAGLDKLREETIKQQLTIKIDAAAEYYLDETFVSKLQKQKLLTLGQDYLLFELSFVNYPQNLFDVIFEIQAKGYKPVLAHPERYPYFAGEMENYSRIKNAGCLLQLNTISLTGHYGKNVQKTAEDLVDNYLVDFIGTDMHHPGHAQLLQKALTLPYVHRLTTDYQLLNPLLA